MWNDIIDLVKDDDCEKSPDTEPTKAPVNAVDKYALHALKHMVEVIRKKKKV